MQNLKRNWLVSSKLTWGIWQILTRALENLKNLQFNGLLLTKAYNIWAKKSIAEICLMALNIDAKFERKMTCAFKHVMKYLANFHQSKFRSLKFETLMASFYRKYKMNKLKIYRGFLQNLKRNWFVSSKLTWGIWQILTRTFKNLKNLHFGGLLFNKVYNVWAKKKYRVVIFDGNEYWCNIWRKTDLCFQK